MHCLYTEVFFFQECPLSFCNLSVYARHLYTRPLYIYLETLADSGSCKTTGGAKNTFRNEPVPRNPYSELFVAM